MICQWFRYRCFEHVFGAELSKKLHYFFELVTFRKYCFYLCKTQGFAKSTSNIKLPIVLLFNDLLPYLFMFVHHFRCRFRDRFLIEFLMEKLSNKNLQNPALGRNFQPKGHPLAPNWAQNGVKTVGNGKMLLMMISATLHKTKEFTTRFLDGPNFTQWFTVYSCRRLNCSRQVNSDMLPPRTLVDDKGLSAQYTLSQYHPQGGSNGMRVTTNGGRLRGSICSRVGWEKTSSMKNHIFNMGFNLFLIVSLVVYWKPQDCLV